MNSDEFQKMTFSQMGKVLRAVRSPAWRRTLEGKPELKARVRKMLPDIYSTYVEAGNKTLSANIEELAKNEQSLIKGRDALEKALKNLKDVQTVLDAISEFLEIVGKVL